MVLEKVLHSGIIIL